MILEFDTTRGTLSLDTNSIEIILLHETIVALVIKGQEHKIFFASSDKANACYSSIKSAMAAQYIPTPTTWTSNSPTYIYTTSGSGSL